MYRAAAGRMWRWRARAGADVSGRAADDGQGREQVSEEQNRIDEYARKLAMHLWRTHYIKIAPRFELLEDTYGVMMQIDNMITGLSRTDWPCHVAKPITDQRIKTLALKMGMAGTDYENDPMSRCVRFARALLDRAK
jgi:hypothetical protein